MPGDVGEHFLSPLDILGRFESIIEKLKKQTHLHYRDQLANRFRGRLDSRSTAICMGLGLSDVTPFTRKKRNSATGEIQ